MVMLLSTNETTHRGRFRIICQSFSFGVIEFISTWMHFVFYFKWKINLLNLKVSVNFLLESSFRSLAFRFTLLYLAQSPGPGKKYFKDGKKVWKMFLYISKSEALILHTEYFRRLQPLRFAKWMFVLCELFIKILTLW